MLTGAQLRIAAPWNGNGLARALNAGLIRHARERRPAGGAHAIPLEALCDEDLEPRAVHLAAEFKVSAERIRQIEAKALEKMKKALPAPA